jgi:hypothetical protein
MTPFAPPTDLQRLPTVYKRAWTLKICWPLADGFAAPDQRIELKQYRNSRLFLRNFFGGYPIHFFEMRYLHYPENGIRGNQSAVLSSILFHLTGLLSRNSFLSILIAGNLVTVSRRPLRLKR